jgi:protein-S-isoprenylcysteine O-methyltransferase Ste14
MERRIKSRLVTLEATGAIICFVGGLLAGVVGTLLSASAWILGAEQHPWVRGLGTALLVVTIPLLIFAGYFMDWMERDSKKTLRPTSHR